MNRPHLFGSHHHPVLARPQLHLKRVRQLNEAYCGPAVLEILLSHLQIYADQRQLAHIISAEEFIDSRGTRVDELAAAIAKSFPNVQLWYKDHATPDELAFLVHQMHYPVGIEWQGLFYNSVEEEEAANVREDDRDWGHYSVVKHIDQENDAITLADPYMDFCDEDRVLSLSWFLTRWWDYNEVLMNKSYPKLIRDERMMFILTLKGTYFPKMMGMKSFGT